MKPIELIKELPNAHQHFHAANSGACRHSFYPYKAQILKRYGIPDGYDVQHIQKECWHCDGSGIDPYTPGYVSRAGGWTEIYCDRCCGSGFYRDTTHYLQRYRFGDRIYHTPKPKDELIGDERQGIQGFIEHSFETEYPPELSIQICVARWLPMQFLALIAKDAVERWKHSDEVWKYRFHRKWIKNAWKKDDDGIPF